MANSSTYGSMPNAAKTQFYNGDGYGRDSYIYGNNGGFCPPKEATKIHPVGKFIFEIGGCQHFQQI